MQSNERFMVGALRMGRPFVIYYARQIFFLASINA